MNTREYRAAIKGDSWKFKLMNAIDQAMEVSNTKGDFIANMERMGYGVKWIDHYKYITYTTPECQRCRDNRLHDEKYLKERMEVHYGNERIESQESARQSDWRTGEKIADRSPGLRSVAGSVRETTVDDYGSRQAPSTHAGENLGVADMGGLEQEHSAGSPQSNDQPHSGGGQPQKRTVQRYSISAGRAGNDFNEPDRQQTDRISPVPTSAGQHAEQAEMEAAGDWGGNRSGCAATVLGAALAIENLLVDNTPKAEQPKQVVERKNRQRKKQENDHGFDRGMEIR